MYIISVKELCLIIKVKHALSVWVNPHGRCFYSRDILIKNGRQGDQKSDEQKRRVGNRLHIAPLFFTKQQSRQIHAEKCNKNIGSP